MRKVACIPAMEVHKKLGFTLAELLIALAILGVIATFTIPKILTSQTDAKNRAMLKEAVATMSQIVYTGTLTGELNQTTWQDTLRNNLNYIKYCNDAGVDGCWPGSTDIAWFDANAEGMLLHNGTMIADLEYPNVNGDSILIDINGVEGPNEVGNDQIAIVACWSGTFYGAKAGQVTADSDSAESEQFFADTFSR